MERYTNEQIENALFSLNNVLNNSQSDRVLWQINRAKLCKSFIFEDFKQAFAFMSSVAIVAEELNHHPDWQNSYNRVDIALSTHDAKGVTELDFQLAAKIETISR